MAFEQLWPHPLPHTPTVAYFQYFWPCWAKMGAHPYLTELVQRGMLLDWTMCMYTSLGVRTRLCYWFADTCPFGLICLAVVPEAIPLQCPMSPYKLEARDVDIILQQMHQHCLNRAVEDVLALFSPQRPQPGVYFAPVFVVHQNGKPRVITDYTDVNVFLPDHPFGMEAPKTIKQLLRIGCFKFGASVDIKNAFPHFLTRSEDQKMYSSCCQMGEFCSPSVHSSV